jgi:hypothetical protein
MSNDAGLPVAMLDCSAYPTQTWPILKSGRGRFDLHMVEHWRSCLHSVHGILHDFEEQKHVMMTTEQW